jgi:hypothetical protein
MHYANLVIVESPQDGVEFDLEAAVENAMGACEEEGGFWDWYQIGGRWTGLFDGYDPEKDSANIVVCQLCNGTGDRPDLEPPEWKEECGGCNGCRGTGKRVTWPTEWGIRSADAIPVEALTDEHYGEFYRVVVRGTEFGGTDYQPWKPIGEMFLEKEMPPLAWLKQEYAGHLAVVVDNHC